MGSTHVNGKDMLRVVQEVHADQATASDLLVARQLDETVLGRRRRLRLLLRPCPLLVVGLGRQ